jgi:hypothetical protein
VFHLRQQDTPDSCWTSVEEAFLISIREGVFFDRKYLARHYKAGDLFKPVYFSGKIMDDKAQQLKKRALRLIFWYGDLLNIPSGKILQG